MPRSNLAPTQKSSRGKGRPAGESQGVGRASILDATLLLLRTTRPARMTLSGVARAAGCDPALVRYYFGDLESVLVAAAAVISEEMHRKAEAVLQDQRLDTRGRLKALVLIYLGVFVDHPFQHQLFVDLILPRRGAAATALHESAVHRVYDEIRRATEGVAGPDAPPIDPVFAYVAIFGMVEFFVSHNTIRRTLRPAADETAETEAYADFIVSRFAGF